MGLDDIPVGPEMFEKWAGPKWGIRIWRVFFTLVVFAIVGGILFAAWKAFEEISRSTSKPPLTSAPAVVYKADPSQAAQIRDLQDKLAALQSQIPATPQPTTVAIHSERPKKVTS